MFGRKKEQENRSYDGPNFSIGDPALAAWLGISARSHSGVVVNEATTLGIPAVYRSISLLAGVIGQLPMKAFRTQADGSRLEVSSFLDKPHPEMTQYEWIRLVVCHHVFRGNVYLLHMYNNAGAVIGLQPIHPGFVAVMMDLNKDSPTYGQKIFKVTYHNEVRVYTSADILHIPNLSVDGIIGIDPLTVLRESFGTAAASEEARGRHFANGGLISGIVTTEEDVDADEAKIIKQDLTNRIQGVKNAGDIAFCNRSLKFTPWSMTNADAEFVATLQFQVEEISRIFGVPLHLLAQIDKQTSWGMGVAEQNLGLQKYVLMPITTAIEQRLSLLLSRPTFVEFLYEGLLAGTPMQKLEAIQLQLTMQLITQNEARHLMNLPPVDGGDVFLAPTQLPAVPPPIK